MTVLGVSFGEFSTRMAGVSPRKHQMHAAALFWECQRSLRAENLLQKIVTAFDMKAESAP